MNSLYTSGVRQTACLHADLDRLRNGDTSASLLGACAHWPGRVESCWTSDIPISCLLGQISASLAAMSRTIEDYDAIAKREMIKAKQEKAQMYVVRWPLRNFQGTNNAIMYG